MIGALSERSVFMNETLGVGVAKTGFLQTLGANALIVVSSPVFGLVALGGVLGWQLWKARKGDQKLKEKAAAAA
jgi:hypothetical protein